MAAAKHGSRPFRAQGREIDVARKRGTLLANAFRSCEAGVRTDSQAENAGSIPVARSKQELPRAQALTATTPDQEVSRGRGRSTSSASAAAVRAVLVGASDEATQGVTGVRPGRKKGRAGKTWPHRALPVQTTLRRPGASAGIARSQGALPAPLGSRRPLPSWHRQRERASSRVTPPLAPGAAPKRSLR